MTSRTTRAVLAGLLSLAAASSLPARAESRPEEDVTPMNLVRRAGLVAVVRGGGAESAKEGILGTLVVEEVLRGETGGSAKPGDTLTVPGRPDLEDVRILPGVRSVAFLSRPVDGRVSVLGGALGLLPVEDSAGRSDAATIALVRVLAADLGPEGKYLTPGAVRAALVAAVRDGSPRVRAGAAFDLVRETGLLENATDTERADLVAVFLALPNRDRARGHLARAVGMLRPEGAGAMLVDAVLAEDGFALRSSVGEALGLLGEEDALKLLAARTAGADAATRAHIAGVLGTTGLAAARAPLEALAGAAEAAVRREAVLGLGRLRTPDAAAALVKAFAAEKDVAARRAAAWALAQCDHPDAWRALEDAAGNPEEEASFRAFVRSVLENPRRSFVR